MWVLAALAVAVIYLARGGKRERWLLVVGTVWLIVTWVIDANVSVLSLCLLILAGMAATFRRTDDDTGSGAIQFLYFAGFGLAAVPELIFLRDFFGPPYERMNTVFKIYYQAWPLLAAASGPAIYLAFREFARFSNWQRFVGELAFVGILSTMVFFAMSYPAITGKARMQNQQVATLDGLDFARRQNPDEVLAVEWLRSNARSGSVIVEATGNAYTEYGRISAWTGIPTIIGWDQHEQLWRGDREEVDLRIADVDALYRDMSRDDALGMLRRYGVSHVYVGRLEREKYGPSVEDIFDWMDATYEIPGSVTIYMVPGT